MKAQRRVIRGLADRHVFEFSRRRPRNLLRVAHNSTGVWILAARDNFSPSEKTVFVQYLVDEGFIPERYRAFSAGDESACKDLEWLIEERSFGRKTQSLMTRLLRYGFVLWAIQIAALLMRS